MKIQCQIEPNDVLEAQLLHIRPRPVLKWFGLFAILMFTVSAIIHLIITPIRHVSWTPLFMFILVAYLVFHFRVLLPRHARKIFTQQKGLQVPYEIEITDDMYSAASERGTSKCPWNEFHKYKRNESTILVYQSDALFHIFQRRWFTDEQFDELCRILESNLGRPKA